MSEPKAIPPLPWTGERLTDDRGQTGVQVFYEHIHRYLFAAERVSGKAVLDIACGEGYGAHLLGRRAASVVGADISAEAIVHARQKYPQPNLSFVEADCASLPFPDRHFDTVVSFETIEHVQAQDRFFDEIARVLKPDGELIISSPDREEYSGRLGQRNKFHVAELSRGEFAAALERRFESVVYLSQRLVGGSFIASGQLDQGESCVGTFTGDMTEGGFEPGVRHGLYLLAVCSHHRPGRILQGMFENTEVSAQMWDAFERMPKVLGDLAQLKKIAGEGVLTGQEAALVQKNRELENEIAARGRWGMSLDEELRETKRLHQLQTLTLAQVRNEVARLEEAAVAFAGNLGEVKAAAQLERRQLEAAHERLAETFAFERSDWRQKVTSSQADASRLREIALLHETSAIGLRGEMAQLELKVRHLATDLATQSVERARSEQACEAERTLLKKEMELIRQKAKDECVALEIQLAEGQSQLVTALSDARNAVKWGTALDQELRKARVVSLTGSTPAFELAQIKSSLSWRWTAPMRSIRDYAAGCARRFRNK